ncbi:hypothetical protein BV898_01037 [Hypsibius exemplaris]|uniref:Metalloendopeptidase n=1 Tax=Hypsibius exemplaris TaxID=2072580 RepID=A0A1W0XD79_HYPEX|nr:hypothetical protein BV898_01037 [Hypsibius exemplaris]
MFPVFIFTLLWIGGLPFATSVASLEARSNAFQRSGKKNLRTINVDYHFQRWPDRSKIYYYLDSAYTEIEKTLIRIAADNVAAGSARCVQFVETSAADTKYKVKVTPNDPFEASGGRPYCYSYPGKLSTAGATEQKLVLTHGEFGCLDSGSVADLMSYWTILTGRRNEHQRGDRDNYITVNNNNVAFPLAYKLYTADAAYWNAFPYDYCSITHNSQTDFAKPGTVAFTVKEDPKAIPNVAKLSNTDCQLISLLYGCPRTQCPAADCKAARQAALLGQKQPTISPVALPSTPAASTAPPMTTLPPTVPATTTPTPTTVPKTSTPAPEVTTPSTSCPTSVFCSKSPDESSFLLGPYENQTYLLFSGSCVMEYVMDWSTGGMSQLRPPKLITEYLPPPGGPTVTPPITLAFMRTGGSPFQLNMQNQAGNSAIQCPTDNAFYTNAAECSSTATSTGVIPKSTATSATTLLLVGDNSLYQLVVDKTGKNLALMDEAFTTTYQTTTYFLSGQTKIAKITAIQMVQDLEGLFGIHPTLLAVFGVASDNATPFVGFAQLPLDASPTTELSPIIWVDEPEPLKTTLKGC